MSDIFISYRRSDTSGHAGRLWDNLQHWFAKDQIFYDLGRLESGDDFPEKIRHAIDRASVVLVVIGPHWPLDRLHDPKDFVRREIAQALERLKAGAPVKVVPVLMGGAPIPPAEQLPEALRSLCSLDAHAFQGKDDDFQNQFHRLLRERLTLPGRLEPRYRAPSGKLMPRRILDHTLSQHFVDPHGKLDELNRALHDGGSAALVANAALYGMGGLGKTHLALKYTLDHDRDYPVVWWFRAEHGVTLEEDCLACCNECGIPIPDGTAPGAALREWLEHADQPAWLLVYDNAADSGSLRPYLPRKGGHHLIVTSRNPAWGGVAQKLELETWPQPASLAYLAGRSGGRTDALEALAAWLGGLPLALDQAASYLEATGMAPGEYLSRLKDIDTAAEFLEQGRAATGYELTVIATLSVAFERLPEPARQLLRLCARLAPEGIPEWLFTQHRDCLPAELATATEGAAWQNTVAELRRYGLAERQDGQLIFHRLTQEAVRAKLADPDVDCATTVALLCRAFPSDQKHPDNWSASAILLPHVRRLLDFHPHAGMDNRALSWLLDRAATFLQHGPALYGEAVVLFRSALEIDRNDLGAEHPDTLASMNNLAATLRAQGDLPAARALEEQVLDVRRRVLGDEHPDTLTGMSNLAATLGEQGYLPAARALQEQVLDISRRVLGSEHPNTLASMNNLAETLRAQDDLPAARVLQEQALEIRRRVLGDEHPNTLASINNLALMLQTQGDLPAARALQEQELEICRRVLGDEHPDTLTNMNNLAATLHAQGDLPAARALQEQVLDIFRRVLGDEHPNTLASMNNLAGTLWAQGDLPAARTLEEQALDIRHHVLGDEHPNTSVSAFNLFLTLLQSEGAGEKAMEVFQSHLAWLLERDPASLGADQRNIQRQLIEFFRRKAGDAPADGAEG